MIPEQQEHFISVARLISSEADAHTRLKTQSISLVPTENLLSPMAAAVLSADIANRYYLTDSTVWEYPQTQHIARLTATSDAVLKDLLRADFVNARPLSGLSAMTCALAAFSNPGSTLYSLAPENGGHGATSSVAAKLGLNSRYLAFDSQVMQLDIDRCSAEFQRNPPALIYIDQSNVLFPLEVNQLTDLVPPETIIYYDCSQILGLMLDPGYFDPRDQSIAICGGSTHKTFPGPQKGVIFGSSPFEDKVQTVADKFVSNHHLANLAALGITAAEMSVFGAAYSRRMQSNAVELGNSMALEGLAVHHVNGQVTGSHQVWVNEWPLDGSPSEALARLIEVNIVANCARLPSLNGSRGLRFGIPEVSRLGMGQPEMRQIARLVADVLFRRRSPTRIRADVQQLRTGYVNPTYCFLLSG